MLPRVALLLLLGAITVSADAPRIQLPEPVPPSGEWRLTWSSELGRQYLLQRSLDLVSWIDVVTVTASGAASTALDPGGAEPGRTFWRVIARDAGSDRVPPTVSIIEAQLVQQDGAPALELTVQATDNVGVTAVGYSENSLPFTTAVQGPTTYWKRVVPLVAGASEPRRFQARAEDAAGNTGFSELYTYLPQMRLPPGFVPVSADGSPASLGLIGQRADGQLTPFRYLVGGSSGSSAAIGGQFDFPDGATVVQQAGRSFIRAREFRFGFGAASSLQIDPPAPSGRAAARHGKALPAADAAFEGRSLSVSVPEGQERLIPVGPVSIAELETLLGLPAGRGIPVKLFDRFSLRLVGGTVSQSGVVAPRWELGGLGLPLPTFAGGWEGSVFDWLSQGEVRLPLHGEIPMVGPDGAGPTLRVARARPLVLTLRADGEVALRGPACLEFPSGQRFCVAVNLDDPKLCLSLRAEGLSVPLLGSLADLLPSNPAACLPALTTDATLDAAESCLREYRRAYDRFGQAALTVRPDHPSDGAALFPPETIDALSALTDAWVASALTPTVQTLPISEVRRLADQIAQAARGASDFQTATAYLATLARLRAAADAYAAGTPSNGDEIPDLRQHLDAALVEAVAAVRERSRDPSALSSQAAAESVLENLSDVRHLAVIFTPNQLSILDAARDRVADGWWKRFIAGLDIRPGIFNHDANPVVGELNRFTALETLIGALRFLGLAEDLGRPRQTFPAMQEAAEQLAGRAFEVVMVDKLNPAVRSGNVPAAMVALRELLDLIAQWMLLAIGDGTEDFPNEEDAQLVLEEINRIVERQQLLPREEQTLADAALRARAQLDVLEAVPQGVVFRFPAITQAHADLAAPLNQRLFEAGASTQVLELQEVLEAGALYIRTGLRFGLENRIDWEATHLAPVVQRIGELCVSQRATAPLDRAIRFLLEEADRFEADAERLSAANDPAANTRQASRRLYYLRATDLLSRSRELAGQLWREAEARRVATPGEFSADAFLPGELKVDAIAGSICYHRTTRHLRGAFSGQLRLPKFDSSLTIANASLSNAGDFDLNAFGQLRLPGGASAPSLVVPQRQPLHLSYTPRGGLDIAGKARLQFSNGLFFEAGLNLNEPLYYFEAAAGGIEVDFARTLAAVLPLGLEPADLANLARGQLWSDYFNFLTACFETAYRPPDAADPVPAGSLPEFTGEVAANLTCLLDAWSCLMIAEAERGTLERYRSTYAKVGEILDLLDQGLQSGLGGFAQLFGPGNEFEIGYQLRQLRKISLSYAKVAQALDAIERKDPAGAQAIDLTQVKSHLDQAATWWHTAAGRLDDNVEFLREPGLVTTAVRTGFELVAAYATLGLDDDAELSQDQVGAFFDTAATELLRTAGFDRAAGRVNPGLIGSLDADGAREKLRLYLETVAQLQATGRGDQVEPALVGALLDRQRELALAELGFNRATGQFQIGELSDERLQLGVLRLVGLPEQYAAAGLDWPALPDTFLDFYLEMEARFRQRERQLPRARWAARKDYLVALLRALSLPGLESLNQHFTVIVLAPLTDVLNQMLAEASGRLTADEIELLELLGGRAAAIPALATPLRTRLEVAATALDAETTRAWNEADLAAAPSLTDELLALDRYSRLSPTLAWTGPHQTPSILGSLAGRLEATGRATKRARHLSEVARRLQDAAELPVHAPLAAELRSRARQLLNAAREIADGYGPKLDALATADRPSDFQLPASLTIRRVYGSVFYRKDTAFLKGAFGGRLEFPNTNAFFEIRRASLDSQGGFEIQAATGFPLEPGGAGVQVTANLAVTGNPQGLSAVNGAGELSFPNPSGPAGSRATLAVGVSYDGNAPDRPLRFTETAGANGGPALKFSDDFVLFGGRWTAEISTAQPDGMALKFAGRAGFFHREQPLTDPIEPGDFHAFVDLDGLGLRFQSGSVVAQFAGGSLTLAPDVFEALEERPDGQYVPTGNAVTIDVPLAFCVGYDFAIGQPIFSANEGGREPVRFELPALRFSIPGLADSDLTVRECQLEFFEDQFPLLRELEASFHFPMPGADPTDRGAHRLVQLELNGENWRLDGFPAAASLALGQDVRLLELDGLDIDLLGGSGIDPNCAARMSFERVPVGNRFDTRFTLAGGLRGTFDPNLLFDAGANASASFAACGSFAWQVGALPEFSLDSVAFGGRFRIGGPSGLTIRGARTTGGAEARITLVDLPNAFIRASNAPFRIRVEGAVDIAEFVELGLEQSSIVWDQDGSLVPRFEPGGFYGALGEQALALATDALPLYPTLVGLRFRTSTLPLLPSPGQAGLFDPTNVIALVSGVVSLPNGAAVAGGSPGLSGSVDQVEFGFRRKGGLLLPDPPKLNGFCVQLQNLDIPPLGGINGGICLGNLQALSLNPPRPQDIYFAGQLGGKYQDIGAEILLATKPTEFIGTCFSLNAGPAGIPLDGGLLGGILLTGGKGGINFNNSFADPCKFSTYIDLNSGAANFPEPGSPDRPGNPPRPPNPVIPPDFASGPISCVQAPFPPPTVNPLCEIHPVTGRTVFKGTRVDEATLDRIGLTRAALRGLSPNDAIDRTVSAFTGEVNRQFDQALALVDSFQPPADARAYFESLGRNVLRSFDGAARTFFREVFRTALNANPNVDFHDLIVAKAAEGIPCFDTTLKLEGTFSHAAISTILSGSGGVTVSSTGTQVLDGRINLMGLPVGEGTFAISLTDSTGAINPAFGGLIRAAVGPLEFGNLSLAMSCDGCFTVVLDEFAAMLACQGGALSANAAEFMYQVLDRLFSEGAPHSRAVALLTHFNRLNAQQKNGFVGAFYNVFQSIATGQRPPFPVGADTLADFLNCFTEFVVRTLPRVNPNLCFSGSVGPKLFGFPLTGGADSVFGATMTYRRMQIPIPGQPGQTDDFQEFAAQTSFSPTFLLLAPLVAIGQGTLPAAIDQAGMGFSLRVPAWTPDRVRLALTNPVAYAEEQMTTFVNDAVFTFDYAFQPLGFKLAKGQGRMVMPRIDTHPRRPGVNWRLPDAPNVASRAAVILAALNRDRLKDPTWRGSPGELDDLFLEDPAHPILPGTCAAKVTEANAHVDPAAMEALSFARDYFPHGGLIGGGEFSLPSVLADAPPIDELAALLDFRDGGRWLQNAQFVFEQYLTKTTCAGQLAFYLPAPNPPADFPWDQNSVTRLVDSLRGGDFAAVIARNASDLYPLDEIVFGGWMEAPLFGTPLGRAVVEYKDRTFLAHAEVPQSTWLGQFVNGTVDVSLKAPKALDGKLDPRGAVEFFQERLAILQQHTGNPTSQLMQETAQVVEDFLPKASFEAGARVQIPDAFAAFLRADANATFGVFGFSPLFEPDFEPSNEAPYAIARRRGGFGLKGSFIAGFFPAGVPADQHLLIRIPDASFAITPDAGIGLFPALSGQLLVDEIQLPGVFQFGGQAGPPFRLRDGRLYLNTSPAVGETFIAVEGKMTPFNLGPFLDVQPLPGEGGSDNLLGGTLRVKNSGAAVPVVDLALRAAQVKVPVLGPNLVGRIFGQFDPATGKYSDFTFSTVAGQAWHATLQLDGRLEIRSPLDPAGPTLFQAEALRNETSQPVPFLAELDGVGLDSITLRLTIPTGLEFTFFPGTPHASKTKLGNNSATCLFVSTDGRIYFDSGTQTLDLAGIGSVRGRLEFGFEPIDRTPALGHSTPASFSTTLGRSQTRTVSVTNANPQGAVLEVDASLLDPTHFTVTPNRLLLRTNESANLTVRFTPRNATAAGTTLRLVNNSAAPVINVPLSAGVTTAPRLHVSPIEVDFGSTPLAQPRSQAVRISNLGDALLSLTTITTSGAPFSEDAPGSITLAPGATREILVTFTPTANSAVAGTLTFNSNDSTTPSASVRLAGRGSDRFWYHQRRGHGVEALEAVSFRSSGFGFAVGGYGAFFQGSEFGRVWQNRRWAGSPQFAFVVQPTDTTTWAGGGAGVVWRSADGGTSWTASVDPELADTKADWRGAATFDGGRLAVAGTAAGKGRVVFEAANGGNFVQSVMPAGTPALRSLAFGSANVGLAVGEGASLLRTVDGAKTWQRLPTPANLATNTRLHAVAVHPNSPLNYLVVGDGGLILRTVDAGTNWTTRASGATEDLHAVARTSEAFFAAGNAGTVLRGGNSGLTWTAEVAGTGADFRGLAAAGAHLWGVTANGDILHRQPTPITGPITVVNAEDLEMEKLGRGERGIREVSVSNEGTAPVTAGFGPSDHFSVRPKGSSTVPPGGEQIFTVSIEEATTGPFAETLTLNTSDPAFGGVKLEASARIGANEFTPLPYVVHPTRVAFGAVTPGQVVQAELLLENLGQADLVLDNLEFRHDQPGARYEVESKPLSSDLAHGFVLTLSFVADRPGRFQAELEIASNARNGLVSITVEAEVVAPREVLTFATSPRGLPVTVNGTARSAPFALTVVDGAPANTLEVQRGSVVDVSVAATATRDGVPYEFQRWSPGTTRAFNFVAGGTAGTFTAEFATSRDAGPAPPALTEFRASPCDFSPPGDVAFGPWVRITEARLTLPWLGDGTTGSDFKVEGALFLSLQRAYGSLSSSRIRARVPTTAPAFGGLELIEITPGSWNFDIDATGRCALAALSPGLQLLDASALPPSRFTFEVDLREAAANRRGFARFELLDELPLAPSLLAVGPGADGTASGELEINLTSNFARLGLNGRLLALTDPRGPGWVVNRPFQFNLRSDLPQVGAVEFTSRTTLADLGAVRVQADVGARIGPVVTGGLWSLTAEKLLVEFFRNNAPLEVSTTVAADGTFQFDGLLPRPTAGVPAGPIRLVARASTDAARKFTVAANPLQARLAVQLPAVFLNSPSGLWPSGTIGTGELEFDSADFEVRTALPSLQLAQDLAGVELKEHVRDRDNFFEFTRSATATKLRLRNRQDLLLGALKVKIDVSNSGGLSGALAGRIGLDGPPPLDQFSDRVSLRFDPDRRPQFRFGRHFLGVGALFEFGDGAPLGRACVLLNPPTRIDSWSCP